MQRFHANVMIQPVNDIYITRQVYEDKSEASILRGIAGATRSILHMGTNKTATNASPQIISKILIQGFSF